ncbi:MAG: hypothetical protein I8H79_06805 [Burkholderiales bacterium]|jgi:hypothetical protein|uniref:hypothetical protein n=1 Tax=Cupriavidus metallidurans TaxID=119219 RepID=UPI0007897FCB|nr:hypothetical protein [Cupriavidus metallidurans]MBH1982245.1 hypothetical protein [Burkholderiales bacterium]MBH2071545.1 hypothetical protein [Burkholderiales bacterium]
MKAYPFTRPTIVAAVEFLGAALTQAKFDQVIVRLELDNDIALASPKSVTAKSALLAQAITRRATQIVTTVNGQMTLAEAAVRIAVEISVPTYGKPEQASFLRGLALDGYVVSWDEDSRAPSLRAALPEEVDLPVADDEVHQLLKHFNFIVPMGHLNQAIEAHTRGDWAAANSQTRSFLEGLLSDIALRIEPEKSLQQPSSENRRGLLATSGFLSMDRNEWTTDGKNYINGLFKMLHTDGSHPGLSDEDHSTFRLHLALITGRTFLRRLHNGK